MSPTTKKILIAVVVLIIAMIVYGVFFRGNTPAAPTSGLTSASGSTATAPSAGQLPPDQERINREFLVRLLNLNNIKLNSDIFTSAGFNGLEDYSFRLPPITNQGRPNPFTTLGSDSGTPAFPVTPPPNNNPPADEPPQNDNPPAGNGVTTNGATAITKNGATLSGQITGGTPTARWFEWGRTSSLGNLTPQISANKRKYYRNHIYLYALNPYSRHHLLLQSCCKNGRNKRLWISTQFYDKQQLMEYTRTLTS